MTAVPLHAPAAAADPTAGIRRELGSLVVDQRLGEVARQIVREAPELSIGVAALLGFVLGDGIPPTLVRLAARHAGRMAVATFLQQQLFTPRRTP